MIRIASFLAGLAGAVVLAAPLAADAQDAAPPGCRWQPYSGDTVLACKDGKGYWRRSGDDEIVGRYALTTPAKPKPKPDSAPVVAANAAPAPKPAVAPPAASAAAADSAADAATTTAEPMQPAVEAPVVADFPAAEETAAQAEPAPAAVPEPAPPAKAPWWKTLFSSLWIGLLDMLRLLGLLR